jgi:protein-S-isoprenylcysteine O-methyltransferase Ste14
MKNLWNKAIDMPPVWTVLFIVVIYFQTRIWNPLGFDGAWATWLGWLEIAGGLAIFAWAFMQFRSHKTSIVPRNVPKAFIAKGPYRFSRNPIYLADAMIVLGFALLSGSLIGVALVPVLMWVIRVRFIKGEEAGLRAAFPEEFAAFCKETRRWF